MLPAPVSETSRRRRGSRARDIAGDHSHHGAEETDLLSALAAGQAQPVPDFRDSWTTQAARRAADGSWPAKGAKGPACPRYSRRMERSKAEALAGLAMAERTFWSSRETRCSA